MIRALSAIALYAGCLGHPGIAFGFSSCRGYTLQLVRTVYHGKVEPITRGPLHELRRQHNRPDTTVRPRPLSALLNEVWGSAWADASDRRQGPSLAWRDWQTTRARRGRCVGVPRAPLLPHTARRA